MGKHRKYILQDHNAEFLSWSKYLLEVTGRTCIFLTWPVSGKYKNSCIYFFPLLEPGRGYGGLPRDGQRFCGSTASATAKEKNRTARTQPQNFQPHAPLGC